MPIPGADLPPDPATIADWQVFGDLQTGQLEKANGRTADAITIVETCEARDKAIAKRIARPWWRFWG